jgi:hypothetical protein
MKNGINLVTIIGGLVLMAILSCTRDAQTNKVRIVVTVGTNGYFVLSIENPTPHVILFDDPRFSRSTRFDWELFSGQEIVAHGGRTELERDPLLPGHLSTGPMDIWPGGPLKRELSEYYPDLGDEKLIRKASSLLWYCRVWDQTATNWIQASGMVHLK